MICLALLIAIVAFSVSETALLLRKRSVGAKTSHDKRSLLGLWIVIPASLCAGLVIAATGVSALTGYGAILCGVGIALVLSGLLIRWYAILYLGRWFTVDLTLVENQELVTSGPYRLLRHPSYTGVLVSLGGIGLLMQNSLSLIAVVTPPFLMFIRRIKLEEAMLATHFGARWAEYAKSSWRLIPFVF